MKTRQSPASCDIEEIKDPMNKYIEFIKKTEAYSSEKYIDNQHKYCKEIEKETKKEIEKEYLTNICKTAFYRTDTDTFYNLTKELLEHQYIIIQNARRLILLKDRLKEIYNLNLTEQCNTSFEDQIKIFKNNLEHHDSDKFEDKTKSMFYIFQAYLTKNLELFETAENTEDIEKGMLKSIGARVRAIHGFDSKHHAEYYNAPALLEFAIILEHVSDVMAIGDKNGEYFDDFYKKCKKNVFMNFSENNDETISFIYNMFKGIYDMIPSDEYFIEAIHSFCIDKEKCEITYDKYKVKLEKGQIHILDEIKGNGILSEEAKNTLKKTIIPSIRKSIKRQVIYSPILDCYETTNQKLRILSDNLCCLIKDDWDKAEETFEAKYEVLEAGKSICEYKTHCFDETFNLEEELKKAIDDEKSDEKTKLLRVSALLATIIQTSNDTKATKLKKELVELVEKNIDNDEKVSNISFLLDNFIKESKSTGEQSSTQVNGKEYSGIQNYSEGRITYFKECSKKISKNLISMIKNDKLMFDNTWVNFVKSTDQGSRGRE